jgi:hypothetical protein
VEATSSIATAQPKAASHARIPGRLASMLPTA